MIEKIKHYQDLNIWKEGINLVKLIYAATDKFPSHEKYGLTTQMRRAAVSVPSNVAEGFRRYHNKEYKQFLYVLLGSCAELETQTIIAKEMNYMSEENKAQILEKSDYVCRMTSNLIKKL